MSGASSSPSPKNPCYLTGLLIPQQLKQDMLFLRNLLRAESGIPAPMPPILPLRFDTLPVKPPLTGLLPAADTAVEWRGLSIINNSWIIREWSTGDWPDRLAANLGGPGDYRTDQLFPLCRGVPLGVLPDTVNSEDRSRILSRLEAQLSRREKLSRNPGWRAMELACWKIETSSDRPWYAAVAWQMLWKRRLKRAPQRTNIDKNTKLA